MAADKKADNRSPLDIATEQGFLGTEVDRTPNENYTVAGTLRGASTPEDDKPKQAEGDGK